MAVLNCLGEDIQAAHSLKIYGTEGSKTKCYFLNSNYYFLILGVVSIPTHFWCPTRIILPNGHHVDHHLPETIKKTNYEHSAGLRYEAIACHDQIMTGKIEHPYMTLENSLQIARIIEEARKQILASKN